MLIVAFLTIAGTSPAPMSDEERRAGLEITDVTASNGQKVRSVTTRIPPERFYQSMPDTGETDYLKNPKVMLKGGWSGYALFELHRREKTTPMVTVSFLQFSKTQDTLTKVEVFGEPAPPIGVKFEHNLVGEVPCLASGACPQADGFEVVVQPWQYRRLLSERRGIPVKFFSARFGRISVLVPQSAVDAVLEVAASEQPHK